MDMSVEGIPRPEKGAANGVCPLDGTAKVDSSYLPASVTGSMEYKGPWDASGGVYPTPAGLELGWYYKISVKGTLGIGVAEVGDMLVCEDPVAPTWSLYQGNLTTGDLAGEVQANGANLTALRVMETDAAKKLISAAKGSAYNKNFGATPNNIPKIGVTLTNGRIVETNVSSHLISVAKEAAYNKIFGTAANTVCEGNDARLLLIMEPDVTLAGVAPVYADLTGAGWVNGDRGMGVGTGGRIFLMSRYSDALKYVELS